MFLALSGDGKRYIMEMMPQKGINEPIHEIIESPYRISWTRVGKIILPPLLLVLILSYWFVYIHIPSLIEPSKEPIKIPDIKTASPSAKPATPSTQGTSPAAQQ